jgi:hypothetical protein
MANKEQCDQYAAELVRRFEDMTKWAVANWPREDFPLLDSDFKQSRRELGYIVGEKLGDGDKNADLDGRDTGNDGSGQYIDMNPMPWP